MKLSQFDTKMPVELIAQHPAKHRDESRLMVLHRDTGDIEHRTFKDILDYFKADDLMVFNDTQVFPAKLYGNKEKTGARIEVFLLRELNSDYKLWDVLVEPARKIRIGNKLYFGLDDSMVAEVIDNTTSRGRTLRFLYDGPHEEFKAHLFAMGHTPLPPYVTRDEEPEDVERYQTIFARNEGTVVAPHAGMHFSRELMRRMEIRDIDTGYLTMHMGLGCYKKIEVEDLTKHRVDSEQMEVTEELSQKVNAKRDAGHKICAVGVTVLRAMETTVGMNGHIKPFAGWTNRFIFPPYEVTTCDALVTNFHLPFSTMLMATAAFGGYKQVMDAYKVAIEEKYAFGGYGDAMLII
ncbi:MAG: tRNA preQ1(34) S-adenosylmethionine ribosyltransferase-isomerase QueA [Muribaculaceae bacterium]|nr:tRNA preQ1(34) S-adenosylmethionine ribosyltransferase-isomerase QueA [Muribaculaceae bacterium]